MLHLGELNTTQLERWQRTIEVAEEDGRPHQMRLFTDRHGEPRAAGASEDVAEVLLSSLVVRRPRQFGACWVGCKLWEELDFGEFWQQALGEKSVRWLGRKWSNCWWSTGSLRRAASSPFAHVTGGYRLGPERCAGWQRRHGTNMASWRIRGPSKRLRLRVQQSGYLLLQCEIPKDACCDRPGIPVSGPDDRQRVGRSGKGTG